MIEIRKEEFYEVLTIDDVVIEDASVDISVFSSTSKSPYYDVEFYEADIGLYEQLLSKKINEFKKINRLKLCDFFFWLDLPCFSNTLNLEIIPKTFKKSIDVSFSISIEPDNWKLHFSISEYVNMFKQFWKELSDVNFYPLYFEDSKYITLRLDITIMFPAKSLIELIKPYELLIHECHKKTVNFLNSNKSQEGIQVLFDFPEELKIPCEQYLLYFAQFLRDLGIDTTSNLKEEAGKVLFSVTPTDDIEALDKIREALAVYLNLPSSPVLYNDSFQSMQLKQQVENLQHSQRMKEMEMRSAQYALRLAQQNIENQDKIITRQNSFIDNQNKIIEKITSKSVMIDSLENKEELEKFCEGFEVGKSEFLIKHFGLHLNPVTVLKNVGKKILGKDESKSILDLNEEKNQEDN
jgi:hypothetical protein